MGAGRHVSFRSASVHSSRRGSSFSISLQRMRLLEVFEGIRFQLFIMSLVLLDIVVFFLETFKNSREAVTIEALVGVQCLIAVIFVTEIGVKIYAYRWRRFATSTTNMVDAFVVVITTMGVILQVISLKIDKEDEIGNFSDMSNGSTMIRLVRLVRLARLLRIYRVTDTLRRLPSTSVHSTSETLTPFGRVLDILQRTRRCLQLSGEFDEYVKFSEIDWVMGVIRDGKLGVAVVRGADDIDKRFLQEMGASRKDMGDRSGRRRSSLRQARRLQMKSLKLGNERDVEKLLESAHKWDFSPFKLREVTGGQALKVAGYHIFRRHNLCDCFGILPVTVLTWLEMMENGYPQSNPYHNSCHASDVLLTLFSLLETFELINELTDAQVLACAVAAIAHDYQHVGFSNNFLILTRDRLALRYNDQSVLESHSLAMLFEHTSGVGAGSGVDGGDPSKPKMSTACANVDIFRNLEPDVYSSVRRSIIDLVMGTDMGSHFKLIAQLEAKETNGFDLANEQDMSLLLCLMLHMADISNPAKPEAIALRWGNCVMEEFRRQGREEKLRGLSVSSFMDPDGGDETTHKCQQSFIDFFALPLFNVFRRFVKVKREHLLSQADEMVTHLHHNRDFHDRKLKRKSSNKSDGRGPPSPVVVTRSETQLSHNSQTGLLDGAASDGRDSFGEHPEKGGAVVRMGSAKLNQADLILEDFENDASRDGEQHNTSIDPIDDLPNKDHDAGRV